jgi:hypothetical protein
MLALGWVEPAAAPEAARDPDAVCHDQPPGRIRGAGRAPWQRAAARCATPGALALRSDGIPARYPDDEYADIARLTRPILAIRAGRAPSALRSNEPPRAVVSVHTDRPRAA